MVPNNEVESIDATKRVSKKQLFRFLELQFARIDADQDGELTLDELAQFIRALAHPQTHPARSDASTP